ncbi:MAG: DUF4194 domain-containing protein [Bdellovibrionaceae bacterium]|nr:DUF4194 domain-containing protein [Pseudobdellovibrionaceae bacterium]
MEKLDLELAGCLRRLLRSRYVLRSRNERWFKMMIDHRQRIQDVASSFAAFLEINEPLGVAYLRPINEEIEEQLAIRLARSRKLSPFASTLLLHLRWQRMQFFLQPTGDDVPVIGLLELRDFLQRFSRAKIDAQFERQFRRCLEELTELQVILETEDGSGFFEITSLCDLLLPADSIRDLRTRAEAYFARTASETGSGGELAETDDSEGLGKVREISRDAVGRGLNLDNRGTDHVG